MMELKDSRVLGLITIACLAVISSHCYLTELSPWAMSVFAVASGYFLGAAHYEDVGGCTGMRAALGFAAGRLGRIYVLYIICILAALAPALYFTLRGYNAFSYDPVTGTVLNVLLLQAWSPEYMFTVNGVGWYFSVCLLQLLLFPFILRAVKRIGTRGKCIAAAFILTAAQAAVSAAAFRLMPAENCKWFNISLPPCRLFDFTLGVIIAHMIRAFPHTAASAAKAGALELLAVLASALSALAYYRIGRHAQLVWAGYALIYALPSFALVLCFARGEGVLSAVFGCRFMRSLGITGAAVYLVHALAISNIISLSEKLGISVSIQHALVPVGTAVLSFLAGRIWAVLCTGFSHRRSTFNEKEA